MKTPRYFCILSVGVLFLNLAACTPATENKDPAVRKAAVEKLTDQSALAKIAMSDPDSSVISAAVDHLTDQTLLVSVALQAADSEARYLALDKITNRQLLSKIALESKDAEIGRFAYQNLFDKVENDARDGSKGVETLLGADDLAMLAKISSGAALPEVREASVELLSRLKDKTILENMALNDKVAAVRLAAVDELADQATLIKIAATDNDEDVRKDSIKHLSPEGRIQAINDWNNTSVDAAKLAGDLKATTSDALEAMARARLAIADPVVASRFQNIVLNATIDPDSEKYGFTDYMPAAETVPGESVSFSLRQGSTTLADAKWNTDFPNEIDEFSTHFLPADVDLAKLMGNFFGNPSFSQDDLAKLANSSIPEVRAAVADDTADQALLAKLASGDAVPAVRKAAVSKLTDQALLAKIAAQDKDDDVQKEATERIATLSGASKP